MKVLLAMVGLSVALNVSGFEDNQAAPKEVVRDFVSVCKDQAVEQEVAKENRAQFLLDCVNDELEAEGYPRLDSLELDENDNLK